MGSSKEEVVYVDKSGKRVDGRKLEELRPIKIEAGVIPNADGSAYLEWGQNKMYVGIYGPKECLPKHTSNPYKAVIKFNYRMATFSVPDRKNPKPGRREMEISKVCGDALEAAIFTERFPNSEIAIDVEIIDSNAGSRAAAITAASVALADAGIPMRDLVSAVGVGRAGGKIILDLNKTEEDAPDAVDMPIAIMPNSDEIVLLQMDGLLDKATAMKIMELGIKGCKQVNELQKQALKKKYESFETVKEVVK